MSLNAASPGSASTQLRLLDPKKTRFSADAYGRIHLEIGIEERHGPVRVFRCRPLTQATRFLSVQDEEGEEIAIIRDLDELDNRSRQVIEKELDLYYLKAMVEKIHDVENKNGILTWRVETDRGPRTVHIRDRQHIRPMPGGRTILTDIHEAKYEIPPASELDERSRYWLEIET